MRGRGNEGRLGQEEYVDQGKNRVEGEITQHNLESLIFYFLLDCQCATEQLVYGQVLGESSEEINLFKMAEAFRVDKDIECPVCFYLCLLRI